MIAPDDPDQPPPSIPALSTPEIDAASPPDSATSSGRRAVRKPSPGLLARMKLLDLRNRNKAFNKEGVEIGRIPEDQLRELDKLHKLEPSIQIERRGRGWSGPRLPGLHPQLAANGLPERGMEGQPMAHESDRSSIISVSDRMAPSDYDDSEVDVLETDTLKYRLPEMGKSRGSSISLSLSRGLAEGEPTPPDDGSRPPTPPPKDSPPEPALEQTLEPESLGMDYEPQDMESYFNPHGLSRAASIYTLSRVSFTNQIQQLTSIKLPDASHLSEQISAIPTSGDASRALNDAAGQIRVWMAKASDVLSGLDAEDDIEWASAGGREGLDEVDSAINVFETLIKVFVVAIEELQTRPDIGSLSMSDLSRLVDQMENILNDWAGIKGKLKGVKEQVEIAMEWEELWNTVLGDIGLEAEALSRLVFEMEERRHRSVMAESLTESTNGLDIESLETIVEETPPNTKRISHSRFSFPATFTASSPALSPGAQTAQEDSNLLALFARMQPLRASLDFLPMRLAPFQMRAQSVFPSACDELEYRRSSLEEKWKKLERDAESLRRELGEDRWVLVFRNAGRQAQKMCESVKRSLTKLREALDEGEHMTNLPATAKKIESFEAKKMHYGPAIERVLMIIDKGVKDRLTVNGEILRLQFDMRREWSGLEEEVKDMQEWIDDLNMKQSQQLRDSISTILSAERSVASSVIDTPGSSPASSVVLMSAKEREREQKLGFKSRQSSFASNTSAPAVNRRYSSLPTPKSIPRKTPVSRSSASEEKTSPNPRYSMATPTPSIRSRAAPSPSPQQSSKPRWTSSPNMNDTVVGHNFKPLTLTTPSPHRKDLAPARTLRSVSSFSNIPQPSPLVRTAVFSPPPPSALPRPASTTPAMSANNNNKRASMMMGFQPPPRTPSRNTNSRASMRAVSSFSQLPTPQTNKRRSALLEPFTPMREEGGVVDGGSGYSDYGSSPVSTRRPSSVLSGRRSSMLPQPRTPRPSLDALSMTSGGGGGGGRDSRAGGRDSRAGGGRDSRAAGGRDSRAGGRDSRAGGRDSRAAGGGWGSSLGGRSTSSRQGDRMDDGSKPRWRF